MRFLLSLLTVTALAAAQSSPPVANLRTTHRDGQTFVTWTDAAKAADGANYRYDIYRGLSPITDAATLRKATLIQSGVFNNSGQLPAQFPYAQATRQNATQKMAIIEPESCGNPGAYTLCGRPLEPFTGLAVHTAVEEALAYYAVITTDRTHIRRDSPISPPDNATTAAVQERVAERVPIKYYDSNDTGQRPEVSNTSISGKQNLPLWFNLHASGGCAGALKFGDLWQYWGDSSMGYQEGIPNVFAVYEERSSTYGPRLIVSPCDTVWTADGLGQLETFWFGYLGTVLGSQDQNMWAFPGTESQLQWILKWTVAHYGADPNRIYSNGQSMGGWGTSSWSLRHPEIFAAVFPYMPRWRQTALPDMARKITDTATSSTLMPDRQTKYLARMDSVDYVRNRCGEDLPFIGWGIGRYDGFATWQEQVDMVKALKTCRLGFAFNWNAGNHSDGSTAGAVIFSQYRAKFARDASYPAFTNSSIDDNPGNGDPANGDSSGCINCGFNWSGVSDRERRWSAVISNSGNTGTMTVDVTPRNTQAFRHGPNLPIEWTSSGGQSGTLLSDADGLVTAPGVVLHGNTAVTVSFTKAFKTPGRGIPVPGRKGAVVPVLQ